MYSYLRIIHAWTAWTSIHSLPQHLSPLKCTDGLHDSTAGMRRAEQITPWNGDGNNHRTGIKEIPFYFRKEARYRRKKHHCKFRDCGCQAVTSGLATVCSCREYYLQIGFPLVIFSAECSVRDGQPLICGIKCRIKMRKKLIYPNGPCSYLIHCPFWGEIFRSQT